MYDGKKFDSILEMNRYKFLEILASKKEIINLECQIPLTLTEAFTSKSNGKIRACTYKADFVYYIPAYDVWVIEDAKGEETDVFKLKKKLIERVLLQPEYSNYYFLITKKPHEEIRDPRIPRKILRPKRRVRRNDSKL
jgi:hypothetical protein